MPRAPRLDYEALILRLAALLGRRGPMGAPLVLSELGISQPTLSRLLQRHPEGLLSFGRARATRYASARRVGELRGPVPIHQIGPEGRPQRLGELHPVEPQGYVVLGEDHRLPTAYFDDLPWFLHDLRPSGFLGRQVPALHPELGAPEDIRRWSGEHVLRYLVLHAHDTVGALLLGDLELHLRARRRAPELIPRSDRLSRYEELAERALHGGPPGSSAAGEQPKFLTWRGPEPTAVLVKFSPPLSEVTARRTADLLVVEHIAHEVLRAHGMPSARSELLWGRERYYLEVERFDRMGAHGRRGVLSLAAFDVEHVGGSGRWGDTALALHRQGRVSASVLERVRFAELFGALIGNTDMHAGNLSFLCDGTQILELAPVYDMTAMFYAPVAGQLVPRRFEPRPPKAEEAEVWELAAAAAIALWRTVAEDERVSRDFRRIAAENLVEVEAWGSFAQSLAGT